MERSKRSSEYSNKHEGLRMSSPPARTCATTSPHRKQQLKAAELPILYAQPASVHFGGFTLDQKSYQQRVFVHNNSAKPVRLQYTMPSKGFFRAAFAQERKPFVSAGLHEELIVTFKPSAFQYHYDCIQVRCEEVAYASNTDTALLGKCLIPIHAYPVLNEVQFPTRMDFGVVPLGDIGRKHFDLKCSVPIEFEYELELAKAHPSFTIFPLRGTIPANGVARIELEFRPLIYATASVEVVLHVSQLGFTPMKCLLAGSSSSDIPQFVTSVPSDATGESSSHLRSPTGRTTSTRGPSSSLQSSSPNKSMGTTTGEKPRKKRDSGEDAETKTTPSPMKKIGNLKIPADLSNMTSVNFILTQQPGKLKPRDLKKAVQASRELRKRQKEEQAKLSASDNNNNADGPTASSQQQGMALTFQVLVREEEHFLKGADVSRQIKEMFFAHELSDIKQMERELEFQSYKVHLGPELLTPEQVAFLQQIRLTNNLKLERRQREKMRNTFSTVAFNMQSQPTSEIPNPPRAILPAHFTPAYTPDFKMYKNDLWARRKRVVQKFIRAVSTCILRSRAQKRLEKIKKWLGNAKTRAQVQEKVALDWQRHGSGSGAATANAFKALLFSKSQLDQPKQSHYIESFPLVEEKSYTPRDLIAQPADWDLKFDAFTFFSLRERDEALLSGHEPLELPPLPTYIPLENDRELRFGAEDELGGPRLLMEDTLSCTSSSSKFPPQMDTRTPSLLQQLPADIFLRPTASVRPLVRIQAPRETDSWYVLRPQRVFRTPPTHFGAIQEQHVGMRSLVALKDSLLSLHKVFLPHTERQRAQPLLHWSEPNSSNDEEEGVRSEADSELYRDVWYISQRPSSGIPWLAERAGDVPDLSDNESDNDDESKEDTLKNPTTRKTKCPTWEDAELLFETDPSSSGSKASESGGGDQHETAGYEEGELLGRANGVSSFERYRHLIRLERAYNKKREELLQLLPNRLKNVAKGIHHPDYELVVEGHGPERPLHQRAAR